MKNLQMAFKAKKALIGEYNITKNYDKVKLFIISSNLSLNGQKKLHKLNSNNIKIIYMLESFSEELSSYIPQRNVKIIGIVDKNFAKLIQEENHGKS